MTAAGWAQLLVLVAAIVGGTRLLGPYLAGVFGDDERAFGGRFFLRLERPIYRLCGIDERREQRWTTYAQSLLAFSAASVLLLFGIQRLQGTLPFNPTDVGGVPTALSWNTAVSFVTNTNWQNYASESTMSHLTQMAGLAVQNFVSAAVGLAVAVALIRGLARRRSSTIGSFWVDLVRGTVRVLLPLAMVFTVVVVSQGAVQTLRGPEVATTVEGATQSIPGGPFASQEGIKEIGTNGGGTLNANSAHPLSNPNGFTNLFQIAALLLIPFGLTYAYGRMVKDQKQGWVVFGAMFALWAGSVALASGSEVQGNRDIDHLGARVTQEVGDGQAGGNMEGKEVRFGPAASGLFAASTTGTSTGAVNSAHDSFTPLGGMAPLVNMMLGEVNPGGVGAGLYGMLVFALLAVFIAGLMVGRTPEYLGKKIQAAEMKLVVLYIVAVPLAVLGFLGASVLLGTASSSILPGHQGTPHGLTEVAYAFTSAGNNNGSAFGGLTGATDWYNTTLGMAMLGRSLLPDDPGPGHRRVAGPEAARPAVGGHVPDGNPTVRRTARGRGPHRRRLDLLPGARPRPDRGAPLAVIESTLLRRAVGDAFVKLHPRTMARNPVMFVVEIGSVLTTFVFLRDFGSATGEENLFAGLVAAWLWFTVLFANLAEAVAEGRGKAQADSLRKARADTVARVRRNGVIVEVPSPQLDLGDECVVTAGEVIPGDGEIIEGIASVDESAITGESAPVIRESGGDRSAVTGGTRVLSDEIVVRITARPGETFLDRMIALVEGASRQKTPNEIALNILLAGLTIIFLLATVTLQPLAIYSGAEQDLVVLIALLVCLIPTTIGALLSAIGIAGMDRLVQRNVLAMSGRAVEAAGDCSTLLLDKTGTITLGNRQAAAFHVAVGVEEHLLADAAQLSSLADETPEGRSIVVLAKERYGIRERELHDAVLVPFTAQTRMSGLDLDGRVVRKGAADSVKRYLVERGGAFPSDLDDVVAAVARSGGTPLVVAEGNRALGVVELKDVVKPGMARPLRRAPGDGHPHGDDHRRQPAHGHGHRRRGGGRRLPRRGHPRGQDGAHQGRAGGRPPRGDDR